MKSILVPVEDHDAMDDVLRTALLLARQFDSYLEGIALGPDLADMMAADFSMSGVIFDDRTRRAFLLQARERFEGFMAAEAVPRRSDLAKGLTFGWTGEALMSPSNVGEYGRVFDVLAVGRPGTSANEPHASTLEAALFESGRPILIAPPKAPATLGAVTTIFWNGSSETARSVSFAMPLLLRARDVVILAVPGVRWPGPSDGQLACSLRRHGVPARTVEMKETKTPGMALLDKATSLGADLIIKGGYTQSRLRQMIFGSVTSTVLAEATLPVFMAH